MGAVTRIFNTCPDIEGFISSGLFLADVAERVEKRVDLCFFV